MTKGRERSLGVREFYESYPCGGELPEGDRRWEKLPWWYEVLAPQPHPSDALILEVGCGTALDLQRLSIGARFAVGIDLARRPLQVGRQRLKAGGPFALVQADAVAIPFRAGSVGACYSIGAMHHIRLWRQALAEIARVLQPGGSLTLLVYRRMALQALVFLGARALQGLARWILRGRRALGARSAAAAEFALHPHVEFLADREWLQGLTAAGFTIERVFRKDPWFPLDRLAPVLRRLRLGEKRLGRFLIVRARKADRLT